MSIPFDQQLVKLRILERRAREEADKATAEYNRRCKELWKPVSEARDRYSHYSTAYMERARDLGYCGWCEQPITECRCVALGTATS